MTATLLLLALTAAPADASASADGPPAAAEVRVEDAGELQGEWEVVGCVINRHNHTAACTGDRLVFAGTTAWIVYAGDPDRQRNSLRINAASEPAEIDWSAECSLPRHGIYRRTGDKLILADEGSGGRRPLSFEPAPGVAVWTLRRVKK
jgi:uncharacterized protein (TIGR03067 family)